MSLTQIRSLLLDLKLTGMHMRLDLVLEESRRHGWSLEESLDALLQAEAETRRERGIRTRIRASRIRGQARFEDYDVTASRSLSRSDFREIASLSWLERGQPLVIIGQTGVGKSFLAQAAGFKACALGKTVLAYSVTGWMDERTEALRTGTILKFRKKMLRPDLLQLDDFGLKKLSVDEAEDLREILEDRSFSPGISMSSTTPRASSSPDIWRRPFTPRARRRSTWRISRSTSATWKDSTCAMWRPRVRSNTGCRRSGTFRSGWSVPSMDTSSAKMRPGSFWSGSGRRGSASMRTSLPETTGRDIVKERVDSEGPHG